VTSQKEEDHHHQQEFLERNCLLFCPNTTKTRPSSRKKIVCLDALVGETTTQEAEDLSRVKKAAVVVVVGQHIVCIISCLMVSKNSPLALITKKVTQRVLTPLLPSSPPPPPPPPETTPHEYYCDCISPNKSALYGIYIYIQRARAEHHRLLFSLSFFLFFFVRVFLCQKNVIKMKLIVEEKTGPKSP
jgi:hypothetical protein